MSDIENFSEYEDIVKKVLKRQPTKAITISINIKNVDRSAKMLLILMMIHAYYYILEGYIWRLKG